MSFPAFHLDVERTRLAMARKCYDWKDLAKVSGVPASTLCRLQRGDGTGSKRIGQIARALGVDVTEIIKEQE